MRIHERISDLRGTLYKEREGGRTVGFVPTMGYLHRGHASLIRRARSECDVVAVSIFVNPLQFGSGEDLARYPRDLDRDLSLCEAEGVTDVFHPSAQEMYPSGDQTTRVTVGPIGERLCGRARPGHFDGVATVVAKLFNIAGPCRAYFGEKDAQQLAVIRRLVSDLDFPVEVVGCRTVRDPDGLALSSRNSYLSPEERDAAPVLKRALDAAAASVLAGERASAALVARALAAIEAEPLARIDYVACVDPATFEDLTTIEDRALLAVAAWFGKARLIDNIAVDKQGE
jgi:pantoate--beta-alanine ligase